MQFIASYTVPSLPTSSTPYDATDSFGSLPGGHYVLLYCNLGAVLNNSNNKLAIGFANAATQLSLTYNGGANESVIQAVEFNTYAEVIAQCYKLQVMHAGGTIGIRRMRTGGNGPRDNPGGPNTTFALYKVNPKPVIECPATSPAAAPGMWEVNFRITNPHPSLDYILNVTAICNGDTETATLNLIHDGNPQHLSDNFRAYFSSLQIPQGATLRLIIEEPHGTAPLYDINYTMTTILSAAGYRKEPASDPGDGIVRSWYSLHVRSSGYLPGPFLGTDSVRMTVTSGNSPRISPIWPGVQLGPTSAGTSAPVVKSTGPCSGFTFSDVTEFYLTVGFIKLTTGTSNVTIRFTFNGVVQNVTWPITT